MSNRSVRAQQVAIDENLEQMLLWYIAESGATELPVVAVDKKSYGGIVLRWLEPILPREDNPLLIEQQLGDNWTLRLEPMGASTFKVS